MCFENAIFRPVRLRAFDLGQDKLGLLPKYKIFPGRCARNLVSTYSKGCGLQSPIVDIPSHQNFRFTPTCLIAVFFPGKFDAGNNDKASLPFLGSVELDFVAGHQYGLCAVARRALYLDLYISIRARRFSTAQL